MRVAAATPGEIRRGGEGARLAWRGKACNFRSKGRLGGESVRALSGADGFMAGQPNQMISLKSFIRKAALALAISAVPILGAGVGPFAAGVAHADVISVIVVKGNVRVEIATIKNHILIKPGVPYAPAAIDQSVKTLFDTGLFSDVNIDRQGSTLVIRVVENPVINTVTIHGSHKIKNDVLVPLLSVHARDVYTDAKVQGDAQRIRDYYSSQGRSNATVDPQVTKLPDNRVDIVFEIH